jgi:hypothetical protein
VAGDSTRPIRSRSSTDKTMPANIGYTNPIMDPVRNSVEQPTLRGPAMSAPAAAPVMSSQQGGTPGTMSSQQGMAAPVMGAGQTQAINPNNPSLRGQQLGFNVAAPNVNTSINPAMVMDTAMGAFNAQIPGMDAHLNNQVRQLGQKTAAMGRTGSGLYDREFMGLRNESEAARQGLLGQMSMQAGLADQSAGLQGQIAQMQGGLNLAGMQQQHGFGQMAHQVGERGYQDMLADRANQQNQQNLDRMQGIGHGYDPTSALLGGGQLQLGAGQQFGANAGQLNQQLAGLPDLFAQFMGGQQQGGYPPIPPNPATVQPTYGPTITPPNFEL